MARYKTKQQVIADFKVNYLKFLEDDTDEMKEKCWWLLLDSLFDDNEISYKQRMTWKYPKGL